MNSNIHLKLEYADSVNSKKDILLSEKNIIQLTKHIKNYGILKKQENSIKNLIKKDFAEIKREMEKIESLMPQDVHFSSQREKSEMNHVEITPQIKKIIQRKDTKSQIEQELEEIEAKLARLQ